MTLRTRLSIVASLLLVVIALAGVLLIRTVEESQIQQIDNQIETVLPIAMTLGIRPPQGPPQAHSSIDLNGVFSNLYVAELANGKRAVTLDPSVADGDAPRLPSDTSTDNLSRLEPQTVGSLTGSDRWRAVVVESPRSGRQVLVAVSLVQADAYDKPSEDRRLSRRAVDAGCFGRSIPLGGASGIAADRGGHPSGGRNNLR